MCLTALNAADRSRTSNKDRPADLTALRASVTDSRAVSFEWLLLVHIKKVWGVVVVVAV